MSSIWILLSSVSIRPCSRSDLSSLLILSRVAPTISPSSFCVKERSIWIIFPSFLPCDSASSASFFVSLAETFKKQVSSNMSSVLRNLFESRERIDSIALTLDCKNERKLFLSAPVSKVSDEANQQGHLDRNRLMF